MSSSGLLSLGMNVGESRNLTRAGHPGRCVRPKPNRFGGCLIRFGRGEVGKVEDDARGLLNLLTTSESRSCDVGFGLKCFRDVGGREVTFRSDVGASGGGSSVAGYAVLWDWSGRVLDN